MIVAVYQFERFGFHNEGITKKKIYDIMSSKIKSEKGDLMVSISQWRFLDILPLVVKFEDDEKDMVRG